MSRTLKNATHVVVLGAKLYRELALSALTLVKPIKPIRTESLSA